MEEPGGSESFGVTPPGVLVEGEGSSAVRAQVWVKVVVTMATSLWSFPSAPSRGKRFLFAFLPSVFSIPFPPLQDAPRGARKRGGPEGGRVSYGHTLGLGRAG